MPRKSTYALIAGRQVVPVENLQGILVLTVAGMMSMAEVFSPEAFSVEDVCLPKNGTLRVIATDGACWATVTGLTALGNVILVPDVAPVVQEEVEQPELPAAKTGRRRAA